MTFKCSSGINFNIIESGDGRLFFVVIENFGKSCLSLFTLLCLSVFGEV